MIHQHGANGTALLLIVGLAVGYEALTLRTPSHRPWSPLRGVSFMTGCGLLIVALVPGRYADFPTHIRQHLVIGMLAPTALVLGAPVTLLLRTLPIPAARRISLIMQLRVARLLTHPVTVLILSVGALAVLHVTPLYSEVTTDPLLHNLVLVHFLVSGYLFAWAIAGPDPAPHRPSIRYRLVVLGVAIAAHAVMSQLLFAGVVGDPVVPDADRRAGATLLYYGGDLAELFLAAALVATWPARRRPPRLHTSTGSTSGRWHSR